MSSRAGLSETPQGPQRRARSSSAHRTRPGSAGPSSSASTSLGHEFSDTPLDPTSLPSDHHHHHHHHHGGGGGDAGGDASDAAPLLPRKTAPPGGGGKGPAGGGRGATDGDIQRLIASRAAARAEKQVDRAGLHESLLRRMLELTFGGMFVMLGRSARVHVPIIVAIAAALLEAAQFISLALAPRFAWSSPLAGIVFKATGLSTFLSFNLYSSFPAFWTLFAIWLIVFALFLVNVGIAGRVQHEYVLTVLRTLFSFALLCAFIPMFSLSLSGLQCQIGYPHRTSGFTDCWNFKLNAFDTSTTDTQAMVDDARMAGTAAIPWLLLLLPSSALAATFGYDFNPLSRASAAVAVAQARTAWIVFLAKVVAVIAVRVMPRLFPAVVSAIVLTAALLVVAYQYTRFLPWYLFWLSQLRAALAWLAAWAAICAIASSIVNDPAEQGTAIVFYLLAPAIVAVAVLVVRMHRRRIERTDIRRIRHPHEVELKVRFFLEPITCEALDPHAADLDVLLPENTPFYATVNEWFALAALRFSRSEFVRLAWAQFRLLYQRDPGGAAEVIDTIESINPSIDVLFAMFRLRQETHQLYEQQRYDVSASLTNLGSATLLGAAVAAGAVTEHDVAAVSTPAVTAAGAGTAAGADAEAHALVLGRGVLMSAAMAAVVQRKRQRDLVVSLALDKHIAEAVELETAAARTQIAFWQELESPRPELELLSRLSAEITSLTDRAAKHQTRILTIRRALRRAAVAEQQALLNGGAGKHKAGAATGLGAAGTGADSGALVVAGGARAGAGAGDGAWTSPGLIDSAEAAARATGLMVLALSPEAFLASASSASSVPLSSAPTSASAVAPGSAGSALDLAVSSTADSVAVRSVTLAALAGASSSSPSSLADGLLGGGAGSPADWVQDAMLPGGAASHSGSVPAELFAVQEIDEAFLRLFGYRRTDLFFQSSGSSSAAAAAAATAAASAANKRPGQTGSASDSWMAIARSASYVATSSALTASSSAAAASAPSSSSAAGLGSGVAALPSGVFFALPFAREHALFLRAYALAAAESLRYSAASAAALSAARMPFGAAVTHTGTLSSAGGLIGPPPLTAPGPASAPAFLPSALAHPSSHSSSSASSSASAPHGVLGAHGSAPSSSSSSSSSAVTSFYAVSPAERLLQTYSHRFLLGRRRDGTIFPLVLAARACRHPTASLALLLSFTPLPLNLDQHYLLVAADGRILSLTRHTLALLAPAVHAALAAADADPDHDHQDSPLVPAAPLARWLRTARIQDLLPDYFSSLRHRVSAAGSPTVARLRASPRPAAAALPVGVRFEPPQQDLDAELLTQRPTARAPSLPSPADGAFVCSARVWSSPACNRCVLPSDPALALASHTGAAAAAATTRGNGSSHHHRTSSHPNPTYAPSSGEEASSPRQRHAMQPSQSQQQQQRSSLGVRLRLRAANGSLQARSFGVVSPRGRDGTAAADGPEAEEGVPDEDERAFEQEIEGDLSGPSAAYSAPGIPRGPGAPASRSGVGVGAGAGVGHGAAFAVWPSELVSPQDPDMMPKLAARVDRARAHLAQIAAAAASPTSSFTSTSSTSPRPGDARARAHVSALPDNAALSRGGPAGGAGPSSSSAAPVPATYTAFGPAAAALFPDVADIVFLRLTPAVALPKQATQRGSLAGGAPTAVPSFAAVSAAAALATASASAPAAIPSSSSSSSISTAPTSNSSNPTIRPRSAGPSATSPRAASAPTSAPASASASVPAPAAVTERGLATLSEGEEPADSERSLARTRSSRASTQVSPRDRGGLGGTPAQSPRRSGGATKDASAGTGKPSAVSAVELADLAAAWSPRTAGGGGGGGDGGHGSGSAASSEASRKLQALEVEMTELSRRGAPGAGAGAGAFGAEEEESEMALDDEDDTAAEGKHGTGMGGEDEEEDAGEKKARTDDDGEEEEEEEEEEEAGGEPAELSDSSWIFGRSTVFDTTLAARYDRLIRLRRLLARQQQAQRELAAETRERMIERLQRQHQKVTGSAMPAPGGGAAAMAAAAGMASRDEARARFDVETHLQLHIADEDRKSMENTKRFRRSFLLALIVLIVVAVVQYAALMALFASTSSRLDLVLTASQRADAAARIAYNTQIASLMRAGWTPPADDQGATAPTMTQLQESLYSLASIMEIVHKAVAAQESSFTSRTRHALEAAVIPVTATIGGATQMQSLSQVTVSLASKGKAVSMLAPQDVNPGANDDVFYLLANTNNEFLDQAASAATLLSLDNQAYISTIPRWALWLFIMGFIVLALDFLLLVRPTLVVIQRGKAQIMEIFMGIPAPPIRHLRALAALQLSALSTELESIRDAQNEAERSQRDESTLHAGVGANSEVGTVYSSLLDNQNPLGLAAMGQLGGAGGGGGGDFGAGVGATTLTAAQRKQLEKDMEPRLRVPLSLSMILRLMLVPALLITFFCLLYLVAYANTGAVLDNAATTTQSYAFLSSRSIRVQLGIATLGCTDNSNTPTAPSTITPLQGVDVVRARAASITTYLNSLLSGSAGLPALPIFEQLRKGILSSQVSEVWLSNLCSISWPSDNPVPNVPNKGTDAYGTEVQYGPFTYTDYFAYSHSVCSAFDQGVLTVGLATAIPEFVTRINTALDEITAVLLDASAPPQLVTTSLAHLDAFWRLMGASTIAAPRIFVNQCKDAIHRFTMLATIFFAVLCALLVLTYSFVYGPLLLSTHDQLRATRAMLLRIPTSVLSHVPVFQRWLRARRIFAAANV